MLLVGPKLRPNKNIPQSRKERNCGIRNASVGGRRSSARNLLTDYIRYGYSLECMTLKETAPLSPAVFHILLALSGGDRHGYGIMKQVAEDSQGRVSMGPGTLYGSLKRMLDAGLVAESDERADPDLSDERRIYYRITSSGSKALAAEVERYERALIVARGLNARSA